MLAVWLAARFLAHERPAQRETVFLALAVAGAALLGLGHKEIGALAVPLAVLVLLLFGGRTMRRPALIVGAAGLTAAFLFFLAWRNFKSAHFSGGYLCATGPWGGFLHFLVSLAEVHLRRFLWPWPLRVYYLPDCMSGLADPRLLLALAQVGTTACVAGFLAWRNRVAALGFLWILLAYLPVSQLIPIPEPVAERFSYQPLFASGLLLAGAAMLLLKRWPQCRRVAAVIGVLGLVAWTGVTHRRAWDWRDDHTLLLANWTETSETRPERYIIPASLHINRAAAMARSGDREGRETELALARLEIRNLRKRYPDNAHGHRLEAVYQIHRGNQAAAANSAREALRLNPNDPEIRSVARLAGIRVPSDEGPRPES